MWPKKISFRLDLRYGPHPFASTEWFALTTATAPPSSSSVLTPPAACHGASASPSSVLLSRAVIWTAASSVMGYGMGHRRPRGKELIFKIAMKS